jgi:hypothetical protein
MTEREIKNKGFDNWREQVDRIFLKEYGIDLEDAGADDESLIKAFDDDETPKEFVEWFGNKYDLDPISGGW